MLIITFSSHNSDVYLKNCPIALNARFEENIPEKGFTLKKLFCYTVPNSSTQW